MDELIGLIVVLIGIVVGFALAVLAVMGLAVYSIGYMVFLLGYTASRFIKQRAASRRRTSSG